MTKFKVFTIKIKQDFTPNFKKFYFTTDAVVSAFCDFFFFFSTYLVDDGVVDEGVVDNEVVGD